MELSSRARIIESAGQVFAEKGFKGATIREICGLAGANLAAVNYHFRDKQSLYIEAVKHAFCCSKMPLGNQVPDHVPPEQQLYNFVWNMMSHLLDRSRPSWHTQIMLIEMAHPTQACVEVVDEWIRPSAQILGGIVSQMIDPAEPKFRVDLTCFSIVGQVLYHRVHRPVSRLLVGIEQYESLDANTLAEHITRFSLAGLGRVLLPEHQVLLQSAEPPDQQTSSAPLITRDRQAESAGHVSSANNVTPFGKRDLS